MYVYTGFYRYTRPIESKKNDTGPCALTTLTIPTGFQSLSYQYRKLSEIFSEVLGLHVDNLNL